MGRARPRRRAAGAQGGRREARRRARAQARRHPAACSLDEAREGRLYTADASSPRSSRTRAASAASTRIRERLSVLATKGYVKFRPRRRATSGCPRDRSQFGYLCVEGHGASDRAEETVDPETGEVLPGCRAGAAEPLQMPPDRGAACRSRTPRSGSIRTEARHDLALRTSPCPELGWSVFWPDHGAVIWMPALCDLDIAASVSMACARTQITDRDVPKLDPRSGKSMMNSDVLHQIAEYGFSYPKG